MKRFVIVFLLLALLGGIVSGCVFSVELISPTPANDVSQTVPVILAVTATQTNSPIPPSAPPSAVATATAQTPPTAVSNEPVGCQRPSDNYARVTVIEQVISARTYGMLEHAEILYTGRIELTGYHLTQGSYTNEVAESFGTHSGGGAVDFSVIAREAFVVLEDDIEPVIRALRIAGFAAWLRDIGELYPGSPIHIHAIAIGDAELSPEAQDQLTGEYGYFRGYNGLPPGFGGPGADRHGGPILCDWMREMGYEDLRTP